MKPRVVATCLLLIVLVAPFVSCTNTVNCCYTLFGGADSSRIHILEWTLGGSFDSVAAPVVAPNTLQGVDTHRAAQACRLVGAQWSPNGAYWLALDVRLVTTVISVSALSGQVEFGPYIPNSAGARLLRYQLASSPTAALSLHLECDDNNYRLASCALTQLRIVEQPGASRMRDAGASSALLLPATAGCARSASITASLTPSNTPSVSAMPSPSPTPLPSYGNVYRANITLSGSDTVATLRMEFSLCYDCLVRSSGTSGARFCVATLLQDGSFLVPAQTAETRNNNDRRRRHTQLVGQTVQHFYDTQQTTQSRVAVTVVWQNGGYCRVDIDLHQVVRVLSCRVIAPTTGVVYEGTLDTQTLVYSVQQLNAQTHSLCALDDDISSLLLSPPSPSTRPSASSSPAVACTAPVELAKPLYAVQSNDRLQYAELTLASQRCSNASVFYSISRASSLYIFYTDGSLLPRQLSPQHSATVLQYDGSDLMLRVDAVSGVLSIVGAVDTFSFALKAKPLAEARLPLA